MTKARIDIRVEGGSGNVFADLGFDNPDEELLKAQLAHTIGTLLAGRGTTQAQAAALLGTTQPKVSLLVRGRTEAFSVQKLFDFLNRLGQDVLVTVHPPRSGRAFGRTILMPQAEPRAPAKRDFQYRYPVVEPAMVAENTPSRRARASAATPGRATKAAGRGATSKRAAGARKKSTSTKQGAGTDRHR